MAVKCSECPSTDNLYFNHIPDPHWGYGVRPHLTCEKHKSTNIWYEFTPYNEFYHAKDLRLTTCQIELECCNFDVTCHKCGQICSEDSFHGRMYLEKGDNVFDAKYCQECWKKEIDNRKIN